MNINKCLCITQAQKKYCLKNCNDSNFFELINIFELWKEITFQYNTYLLSESLENIIADFLKEHKAKEKYFSLKNCENILIFWNNWKFEQSQICPERLNFDIEVVIFIFLNDFKNQTF